MSNPFYQIQDIVADQIRKLPIVKTAIGESGAIPVHVWRGSNLANEIEAGLKKIGFGIVVRLGNLNQIDRDTWGLSMLIGMQINDQFNHSSWGRGVDSWSVAWDIANILHRHRPSGSTGPFVAINIRQIESDKSFIERFEIGAQIQIKTPQH